MSETNFVKTTIDTRGIATVMIDRADKHNAFNAEIIAELTDALLAVGRNDDVRVVILTGDGKSFSAGADLNWMKSMASYSEDENLEDSLKLAELMQVLDNLPKPTIARVNGHVFGGGVGLVACCDIAIAAEHARFALSEVKLGLVPAVISPYVIAAIGERHARRFFLTAEAMDCATARHIGLVHESVPLDELDSAVEKEIELLLAGGPAAQRAAKELVRQVCHHGDDAEQHLIKTTAELIAQIRVSDEGQEGLGAFLDKRPPNWIKD
ncbi:MAG: enoyl-CoA hydratase/isomerase family protein [Gammaproteobacteria bacterium]|nr:enoyl-CoA hydratase/isomerase family protein [Gammaproteobacteria bacterium]